MLIHFQMPRGHISLIFLELHHKHFMFIIHLYVVFLYDVYVRMNVG